MVTDSRTSKSIKNSSVALAFYFINLVLQFFSRKVFLDYLGAEILGVNNRDLRTFQVDMNNSIRLRKMAPDNVVFVSESGIRTPEDIRLLYENKVDAVLIGETLMRSPDKKAALESLNSSPLR